MNSVVVVSKYFYYVAAIVFKRPLALAPCFYLYCIGSFLPFLNG